MVVCTRVGLSIEPIKGAVGFAQMERKFRRVGFSALVSVSSTGLVEV